MGVACVISRRQIGGTLTVLAGDAANGAGQMVAVEGLDVLDLEGLDVEVVESEQGDGIVDIEAERKRADELRGNVSKTPRNCLFLPLTSSSATGGEVDLGSSGRKHKV